MYRIFYHIGILNIRRLFVLAGLLFLVLAWSCTDNRLPYQNTDLSFEERAKDLVGRMTLDEKVAQMAHEAPAIERLGISKYNWWNECLHGVGRAGLATVFPQAIGMAAMWDEQQMFTIATAISDEARAKHNEFLRQGKRGYYQGLTFWSPNINIFRDPRWGRGMETYGEDPYLTGELAVQFIKGLQGDDPKYLKLVATAKHFVVHSGPEPQRHRFNAMPNQRDFIETYASHFRKTVEEAQVYSVMCAYNRLNDEPCCGSLYLNNLLRKEWGFNGYMVSDCGAIQDFYHQDAHHVVGNEEEASVMAVNGGTDLNCGETYRALVKAVKNGLIKEKDIDRSVQRLMVARFKLGMFDPPALVPFSNIPYSVVHSEQHRLMTLEAARKSMVLLKNDNNLLPLSKNIKSVAVIGPNANNIDVLLGNYNGFSPNLVTPYEGIRDRLPQARVRYAQGSPWVEGFPMMQPVDGNFLFTDASLHTNGLKAEYFDNASFLGKPVYTGVDRMIDFVWWNKNPQPGVDNDAFSVRWSGFLVPKVSGTYYLGADGFSSYVLYLNEETLVSRESVHRPEMNYQPVNLEAGKPYKIIMEYRQQHSAYPMARLVWDQPGKDLKAEALDLAQKSDVVVLCMGLSPLLEGEEMTVQVPGFDGGDRTEIALPAIQSDLIRAIRALGKPTVLVLLNGGALALKPEGDQVPAILEAWYPGQEGGTAIADVLFGDYNPAGRLPVTFYESVDQLPPFDDYSMEGRTYKYFREKPLFSFGYGLSYTTFAYSALSVPDEVMADQGVEVSVEVTNTGSTDGEEVAQLYLSFPERDQAPLYTLQGFKRVFLKAGETKTISFSLKPEQFGLYHPDYQKVVYPGRVTVSVGGCQPGWAVEETSGLVEKNINIRGEYACW